MYNHNVHLPLFAFLLQQYIQVSGKRFFLTRTFDKFYLSVTCNHTKCETNIFKAYDKSQFSLLYVPLGNSL